MIIMQYTIFNSSIRVISVLFDKMIWFSNNIFSSSRWNARHMKVGNETYFWNWLIILHMKTQRNCSLFLHTTFYSRCVPLSFYMINIFNRVCAWFLMIFTNHFTSKSLDFVFNLRPYLPCFVQRTLIASGKIPSAHSILSKIQIISYGQTTSGLFLWPVMILILNENVMTIATSDTNSCGFSIATASADIA